MQLTQLSRQSRDILAAATLELAGTVSTSEYRSEMAFHVSDIVTDSSMGIVCCEDAYLSRRTLHVSQVSATLRPMMIV